MLRTGIPVSQLEAEGDAVVRTAFALLNDDGSDAPDPASADPDGAPRMISHTTTGATESYDSIDDSVLHELGL